MVVNNGTFEPTVRVRILDDTSISKIHHAALDVLERTGVAIHTDEGQKTLLDAGCKRSGDDVITIPAKCVEQALAAAPSSVVLYDRLGQSRCVLEGWKTSFGTGSDCPFTLDRDTGEKRQCTYDDVSKGALVCDALDNLNFVMPVGIVSDRPRHVADVYGVEATMRNTVKPVVFTAHNLKTFQASIELAAAVAGGARPCKTSPRFVCMPNRPRR